MLAEMPFVHPELEYHYVGLEHPMMQSAKSWAEVSTCYKQRTGAVIVDDSRVHFDVPLIVGHGNNKVALKQESCPRQNMETGTGYHLCFEKCGGNLHAETSAIEAWDKDDEYIPGGPLSLFLYGHWWCCEDCCNKMVEAGIKRVYLLEGSGPDTRWF